jgi:hypothetical protein
LVLLNPWVKTEGGEARTLLRHYYSRRLMSRAFWIKLLSGGVSVGKSLGGLNGAVAQVRNANDPGARGKASELPGRMARALHSAGKPFVVLLSGRDYVAREFELAVADASWDGLAAARQPLRMPVADHTFSNAAWRDEVALRTAEWVRSRADECRDRQIQAGGK